MSTNNQYQIGLVQIGDKFGGQYYLPYSIGLLQAYAEKNLQNPEKYSFLLPIYKKIKISSAADFLALAQIVFFSVYDWNFKISLAIAKVVKQSNKQCVIVFGGPQVPEAPDEMRAFLNQYSFIDLACYAEGEIAFLDILEAIEDQSWAQVSGVGYRKVNGEIFVNPVTKRISDLSTIPSPYLEGVFDRLLTAYPDECWCALLETNRGCPFSCTYCYWGNQSRNKIYRFDLGRVFAEIDWISKNKIEFVFCCDANYGILERDLKIAKKVADNKKEYGYPQAFSIQNTKNSTKRIFELQKILNDSGLQKGVNLALQSINPETLKAINRNNISTKTYSELQHLFSDSKIATFSDIIIALPNESYQTFVNGIAEVIFNGQHNRIQFINLSVLQNTEMAKAEYQKKHGLIVVEGKNMPHHTSLDADTEIFEYQHLVVGTKKMPKEDWVKTRIFCWLVSLLYFNKLLQLPILLAMTKAGHNFVDIIDLFLSVSGEHRIFSEIIAMLKQKAEEIQTGGSEYVAARDWLNILWPIDEYLFIKLCNEKELDGFYREAKTILTDLLPAKVLTDALAMNQALIKLPFQNNNLKIKLTHNVWNVYSGVLTGQDISLSQGSFSYQIDRTSEVWNTWNDWCREVVWYGTKKGAYFYNCRQVKEMV